MAKNDNLTDYLTDLANAIREKKGTSAPINAQDFASEIASIESGGKVKRVSYLRRVNEGYIDTGVPGANDNLKIVVSYSARKFPAGYWRFISAYTNESTNTTRILLNSNTQILGNINAVATGGSITATTKGYVGLINTVILEPASSTSFRLTTNGSSTTKARVQGDALDKTILIVPSSSDDVDVEIYGCEIYDGSTLIRNFIPSQHGGKFGLYDTITRQFYGNIGGGEFYGEVLEIG